MLDRIMKTSRILTRNLVKTARFGTLAVLLAFAAGLTTGCASYKVQLTYTPDPSLAPREESAHVSVGAVRDERGTRSDWLGAIRGGFGNPLKKLYTERDTALVVKELFEEGLRVRGMLDVTGSVGFRLDITLAKLDTSNLVNGEAHAHLTVSVVDLATQAEVYSNLYQTDNTASGIGPGVFGSVNELRDLANRTLNETIDKVLDDQALSFAVGGAGHGTEAHESPLAIRLRQLDDLLSAGLISQEEYDQARKEILEEL